MEEVVERLAVWEAVVEADRDTVVESEEVTL